MSKFSGPQIKATSDYDYLNARIRGMKSALLHPSQYKDLMAVTNATEAIEVLENTHFSHQFLALESAANLQTIKEVFRRDLSQTIQKVLSMLQGRPRELFESLLLYWDMEAVRTILRGKFAKRSSQDILASTLPVGQFNEALIRELIEAPDVRSVIEILFTWKAPFGKELLKILPVFEENKKIFVLEHCLEKAFFEKTKLILTTLSESEMNLGHFMQKLMDFFNVRAALRLRGQNLTNDQALSYFLGKGHHLGKELFLRIIQQDTSASACQLVCTHLFIAEKVKDERALERVLEHQIFKNGMRSYTGNPLGFDILLGFLWHKVAEIRNASLIVQAKMAQVRSERIEEEIIYV